MQPQVARARLLRSFALLAGAAVLAISFAAAHPHRARAQGVPPPPAPARAEPASAPAAPPGPKERTTIGIHIADIRNVELHEGKFEATFYYWIRHARKETAEEARDLEEIAFSNGAIKHDEVQERRDIDGETYVSHKAEGEFNFRPDLHLYPFDEQSLSIRMEQARLTGRRMLFVDDAHSYTRSGQEPALWGLGKSVWLPEYDITAVERTEEAISYDTDFGNPVLARSRPAHPTFAVTVICSRRVDPYLYKILLPLLVILGTAYLVFWLPPTDIKVAALLAIESLLSCFEFNVAIMEELPEVPYVMLTQKFFLWTFGILFLNLLQSVILYILVHSGHEVAARRWSRTARIIFPILFAACFGGLSIMARYR